MTRPSTFVPFKPASRFAPTSKGVTDFLRDHDKLASLLPSVTRMAALQRDCATALPTMFSSCAVHQFEAGNLVLSTPNAALASKLKQQLPKLTALLQQRGWQVSAIRLKVQVAPGLDKPAAIKQLILPEAALTSISLLQNNLDDTPRNANLLAALERIVSRARR